MAKTEISNPVIYKDFSKWLEDNHINMDDILLTVCEDKVICSVDGCEDIPFYMTEQCYKELCHYTEVPKDIVENLVTLSLYDNYGGICWTLALSYEFKTISAKELF